MLEHRGQTVVDLGEHAGGIGGTLAQFGDDPADERGQQAGTHAVAHHVADENPAFDVVELDDLEKSPPRVVVGI